MNKLNFLVVFVYFFLGGITACTAPRTIGRSADEFLIEPGIENASISPTEKGVFYDPDSGKVRIKLKNKNLVNAIDELAYKAGFNYTMLSDLSTYKVTVESDGSQVVYPSEVQALDSLLKIANSKMLSGEPRVFYRWVSDGPEFFLSRANSEIANLESGFVCGLANILPANDCSGMSFKKMFFKNIASDEALKSIASLFESEVEMKPDSRTDSTSLEVRLANLGKRASLIAYPAQNALLVRGVDRSVYDRLAGMLPSLDADFQLVLVETQVFEYDDSIARKIGVALDYSAGKLNTDSTKPEFRISTQFGEGITDALPLFFWNLGGVEKKATLLSKLALYDRDGLVRIMAEPRLTLKSGENAEVELATKRYYITPGVNTPGEIRELPTGILFRVKPTVLGDGKILLKLYIRQSEFIPSNDPNAVSATNDNRIDTAIIARDGELVSLGGILTKRDSKFASGVPGVRKIPGVGLLFGSEGTDGSSTRIEFMIRPTVKRVNQRNESILKGLKDTNCRITNYMGKKSYECVNDNPVEIDLDNKVSNN